MRELLWYLVKFTRQFLSVHGFDDKVEGCDDVVISGVPFDQVNYSYYAAPRRILLVDKYASSSIRRSPNNRESHGYKRGPYKKNTANSHPGSLITSSISRSLGLENSLDARTRRETILGRNRRRRRLYSTLSS